MQYTKHKLLEIKTSKLVDSIFVWNYKTNFIWKWIEFVSYKEYDSNDDFKNIDFIKSENEWKILVKVYQEERELSVYFIIELNETFVDSWLSFDKIDIVYEILYLMWLSAIKSWDKVWMYVFDWLNQDFNISKKWKSNFINIVNNIENYLNYYNKKEWYFDFIKNIVSKQKRIDKRRWLNYFNTLKIKNSLVFYLTDNLDFDLKELKILCSKNDLILCNIFNSIENNLNWKWILWVNKTDENIYIDLDNEKKVEKYIELRNEKINFLRNFIYRNWWKYLFFDENVNIYREFFRLFK